MTRRCIGAATLRHVSLLPLCVQTLAATSMLMSIGIAVEFIAHPVAAYEFATGPLIVT